MNFLVENRDGSVGSAEGIVGCWLLLGITALFDELAARIKFDRRTRDSSALKTKPMHSTLISGKSLLKF